jgi:hypothetical protein
MKLAEELRKDLHRDDPIPDTIGCFGERVRMKPHPAPDTEETLDVFALLQEIKDFDGDSDDAYNLIYKYQTKIV